MNQSKELKQYLERMNFHYDKLSKKLENHPKSDTKPFLWLSNNKIAPKSHISDLTVFKDEILNKINDYKEIKTAFDLTHIRHNKFMSQFYSHFVHFFHPQR